MLAFEEDGFFYSFFVWSKKAKRSLDRLMSEVSVTQTFRHTQL